MHNAILDNTAITPFHLCTVRLGIPSLQKHSMLMPHVHALWETCCRRYASSAAWSQLRVVPKTDVPNRQDFFLVCCCVLLLFFSYDCFCLGFVKPPSHLLCYVLVRFCYRLFISPPSETFGASLFASLSLLLFCCGTRRE